MVRCIQGGRLCADDCPVGRVIQPFHDPAVNTVKSSPHPLQQLGFFFAFTFATESIHSAATVGGCLASKFIPGGVTANTPFLSRYAKAENGHL